MLAATEPIGSARVVTSGGKMNTRNYGARICTLLLATACSSGASGGSTATAPKAYVGLYGDNAVAVLDTGTQQLIKSIAVPAGPHGLVITPDGSRVYVSSDGASSVSVISTSTDSVVASIDVGMTPHGLSISKDGKLVLCSAFGTDAAKIIDTATNSVRSVMAVSHPHNSAISSDGKQAYVGSEDPVTPAIAVADLQTGTLTTSVPLEQSPRALDFAPNGRVYFTVFGVDGLETLDPTSEQLAPAAIPTGGSPHHMLATKDGRFELVVSQTAGDLEYVDVARNTVVANVPTGTTPHWIGLTSDGTRAYVTNEGSNSVSVVDVAQRTVIADIPVGNAPRKIAVQAASTSP